MGRPKCAFVDEAPAPEEAEDRQADYSQQSQHDKVLRKTDLYFQSLLFLLLLLILRVDCSEINAWGKRERERYLQQEIQSSEKKEKKQKKNPWQASQTVEFLQ